MTTKTRPLAVEPPRAPAPDAVDRAWDKAHEHRDAMLRLELSGRHLTPAGFTEYAKHRESAQRLEAMARRARWTV